MKSPAAETDKASGEEATERILSQARAGDAEAAAGLIDIFHERIYAFLRRLSANDTDAEDLTQRTFTRVWQSLPTFAGKSSVGSWIHGIAYHVYVDWRRGAHRLEARPSEWWDARPTAELMPDEAASSADFARNLHQLVNALDVELRDCVHLHYYQGLTLQETADAMGIAASTVKYRLRQALSELHKKMNQQTAGGNPPANSKAL